MKRFSWIIAGSLILLSGCGFTSEGDAFRALLREKGKAVAAEGLENSEWFMCRGSSVGAVKDRYGVSIEKVEAYNNICKSDPTANPIFPKIIKEEIEEDVTS